MPYIKQERRKEIDKAIDELAYQITLKGDNGITDWAGELNYACTRLGLKILESSNQKNYWKIALISGVFHNIADEFYRRYASPYEDQKIQENGDVY